MNYLTYALLPKQLEFCMANEPEVLYSGAFGAGKTRAVCVKTLMHAIKPGNRVGLCRKTLVSLKATTLKTLLEPDGELPPVLPVGTYYHNKSEKTIKIYGGGEIVYFGIDQASKIGSLNLGACAVDEATELDEEEWLMLRSRCRNQADENRQLFGACNPGPPRHHLAERFGLTGGTRDSNCRVIETRSKDNWFLPRDYQVWLDSLPGKYGQRYRDGQWVGLEGAIYDLLDEKEHVVETENLPAMANYWVGMDYGPGSVTTFWLLGQGADGRFYFVDFWRWDVTQSYQQASDLKLLEGLDDWLDSLDITPASIVVPVDAISFVVLAQDSRAKLKRVKRLDWADQSPGSVLRGIQDVYSLFSRKLLLFSRRVVDKGGLNEWLSYQWDETARQQGKDQPLKKNDHDPDAGRYAVQHVRHLWIDLLRKTV